MLCILMALPDSFSSCNWMRVRARWLLIGALALVLAFPLSSTAQEVQRARLSDGQQVSIRPAPPPEQICELAPMDHSTHTSLHHGDIVRGGHRSHGHQPRLQASQEATAAFDVTYVNAPMGTCGDQRTWPAEAIEAFEAAMDIWETHLESDIPVRIRARWRALGPRVLGSAGPTRIVAFEEDDPARGIVANTWYAVALGNALSGQDALEDIEEEAFDININISCNQPAWHFPVDEEPGADDIDFLTVVLHEVGHGIGIIGSMGVDGSLGSREISGQVLAYDRFAEDGNGRSLIDPNFYTTPSAALADALTGRRGGVFFNGPLALFGNLGDRVRLFAPSEWNPGSSFSHVDQTTFTGTDNALMRPQLPRAERIATPGPVGCGILADMGWPLGANCFELLDGPPLLVTNLDAARSTQDAGRVTLSWTAEGIAREFIVEQRFDGLGFPEEFDVIDRLSGQERSLVLQDLEPGRYDFRVQQVAARTDEELNTSCATTGTAEGFPTCVTAEITTFVTPDAQVFIKGPGPNPFQGSTTFTLVVGEAQDVQVEVFNAAGRRVTTLLDERVAANQTIERTLDGQGLGSGTYFVHFIGASFEETRTVTRVR